MNNRPREEWYRQLIRRHQVVLWRYLRYLGCENTLAEDLLQDVFIAVWKRPFDDQGPQAERAYLQRVAKNLYLMHLRKKRRQPLLADLSAADQAWEEHSSDAGEEYRSALRHCLQGISERARRVIDLFYRECLSRAGIATAMAMTEDGVKTTMRRARENLRACVNSRMAP